MALETTLPGNQTAQGSRIILLKNPSAQHNEEAYRRWESLWLDSEVSREDLVMDRRPSKCLIGECTSLSESAEQNLPGNITERLQADTSEYCPTPGYQCVPKTVQHTLPRGQPAL